MNYDNILYDYKHFILLFISEIKSPTNYYCAFVILSYFNIIITVTTTTTAINEQL